jgi:hypothetical protein
MPRSGQTNLDGVASCPADGQPYLTIMEFNPPGADGAPPQSVLLTAIGGAAWARETNLHGSAGRGVYLAEGVPTPISCGSGIRAVQVMRAAGSSAQVAFAVTDTR